MLRYNFRSIVTVERQADTSGNQSGFSTLSGVRYRGYLAPTANTMAFGPADAGSQTYQLVTDGRNDIREGDRITVDGTKYGVQGIARYKQLSQYILVCTLKLKLKDTV